MSHSPSRLFSEKKKKDIGFMTVIFIHKCVAGSKEISLFTFQLCTDDSVIKIQRADRDLLIPQTFAACLMRAFNPRGCVCSQPRNRMSLKIMSLGKKESFFMGKVARKHLVCFFFDNMSTGLFIALMAEC